MKISLCLLILLGLREFDCQSDESLLPFYRLFRDFTFGVIGKSASEPKLLRVAGRNHKLQKRVLESTKFPCFQDSSLIRPPLRSERRPQTVHELRPGDFDVVAAMGDSLTAGNGAAASNLLQVYTENRGISWSIGGQSNWREFLTIPNILKEFNPKLIGYSLGDALGHHRNSQFNVAEIAAMSRDMPYMAKKLVKRLTEDPRVDIKHDWKLITVLIGGNDFCIDMCYQKDVQNIPDRHFDQLYEALTILKNNLPRTFINVVPAPNIEILTNFTGGSRLCDVTHLVECPCFYGLTHSHKHKEYVDIMKRWQTIDLRMEKMPEFNDRDDFIIVSQPFLMEIVWPTTRGISDYSYLSVDCFHFSQKGYARAANALWNNMLEEDGNKSTDWNDVFKKFLCPTIERPFISTWKNSGVPRPTSSDHLSHPNLLKTSMRMV